MSDDATLQIASTDRQIRETLKLLVHDQDPTAVLFDELPLCRGEGRADVAAVNGAIWGYEIKSDNDGLGRLPKQIQLYNRVFDNCIAVVAPKHLRRVRSILPRHWGIQIAVVVDGDLVVDSVRKPQRNRCTDSVAVMRLMWRDEAVRALRNHGIRVRPGTLIGEIWDLILTRLSPSQINEEVRLALKCRSESGSVWRQT